MTLTELRNRLRALRVSLGRKGWQYVTTKGAVVRTKESSLLFNPDNVGSSNTIIVPPVMMATCKVTHSVFRIQVDPQKGDLIVQFPDTGDVVTLYCEMQAAALINNHIAELQK